MISWCACEYEPQINSSPWYLTLISDDPSFHRITWLETHCPGNALHNLLRTHWSSSGWPLYRPCSWLHRHVAPRSTISDIRRMPHPNSPPPVGAFTIPLPPKDLTPRPKLLSNLHALPSTFNSYTVYNWSISYPCTPSITYGYVYISDPPPSDMSYNIRWWLIWWTGITVWLEITCIHCSNCAFISSMLIIVSHW